MDPKTPDTIWEDGRMEANVIIVGGGPAGIITALTTKTVYPEKSVCVIKEIGDSVIPCAIPYMMQIATRPMLTSAPTVHPLVNAAHMALAKLRAAVK